MSTQLFDQVKNLFTNEVVEQAASHFGETESTVTKAISGIVPGMLGGLIRKTEQSGGADAIFNLIQKTAGDSPVSSISGLLGSPQQLSGGWDLVKNLFGSQSDNLLGKLAGFSGAKVSSITGLLGMAAPMIMGWLGKFSKDKGLSATGLASLLGNEKSSIMNAIPSGLGITDVFSNAFSGAAPKVSSYKAPEPEKIESGGNNKWLLPLLLLLGLAALIWWWLSRNKTEEVVEKVETTVVDAAKDASEAVNGALDSIGNFVYNVGALKDITLPNGSKLNVGENGSEAKIFSFLNNNNVTVNETDKTQGWISLDRVYFETGKNKLTSESVLQLKHIASILKAFPNATIKIGGYTDNTGDSVQNVALSADRAKAALLRLSNLGVDASRLASEGYGPMHPVASNETPEGRAMNRRVDVRVTKK
jgi:outer membrane protein OmpA-like peptidoglycan-associated protein